MQKKIYTTLLVWLMTTSLVFAIPKSDEKYPENEKDTAARVENSDSSSLSIVRYETIRVFYPPLQHNNNIAKRFGGIAAGVAVRDVSGTFGVDPIIMIRGINSLYGNNRPLIIIDGIPYNSIIDAGHMDLSSGNTNTILTSTLAGINHNDVESVTFLRDAEATAIYGQQGMNGAISVVTKNFTTTHSRSVSYRNNLSLRLIPNHGQYGSLSSQQQMELMREMSAKGILNTEGEFNTLNQLIGMGQIPNTPAARNEYLNSVALRDTDWFRELFRIGITQDHSIRLSSGGNDNSKYIISASVSTDPGWSPKSEMERFTFSAGASQRVVEKLFLEMTGNGAYRNQKTPGTIDAAFSPLIARPFEINPFYMGMNLSRTLDPTANYSRNQQPFNPLYELNNNFTVSEIYEGGVASKLRLKLSNLELAAIASTRHARADQTRLIGPNSNFMNAFAALQLVPTLPKYTELTDTYSLNESSFMLNGSYNDRFSYKHTLRVDGGGGLNHLNRKSTTRQSDPFATDKYFTINNLSNFGVFLSPQYTFKDRYGIRSTARVDMVENLGPKRKAGITWNTAAYWMIHNEKFFCQNLDIVSLFRFKASYGSTSHAPTNLPSDPIRHNLSFEKRHEFNTGIEIEMLRKHLTLDINWFTRKYTDLICATTPNTLANIGEMKSSGLELSLRNHASFNSDLFWHTDLTLTYNQNKITKLPSYLGNLTDGTGAAVEGGAYGAVYSAPYNGLDALGNPIFGTGSGGGLPNLSLTSDLKHEGSVYPTMFGGLNNRLYYDNLSLSFLITFSAGNKIRMAPILLDSYSDLYAPNPNLIDRWQSPGDQAHTSIPELSTTAARHYNSSTATIADGSYVRLKEVSLTYALPYRALRALGAKNVRIQLTASNLLLLASKRLNGIDPEYAASGGVSMPTPRQISLSVGLDF